MILCKKKIIMKTDVATVFSLSTNYVRSDQNASDAVFVPTKMLIFKHDHEYIIVF